MSRWVRLCAAVVAMIQIANLQYAWTLFVQPLRDAASGRGLEWSLTDVQWGFTIFIALETWAMPATGWLIDKYGARALMSFAGVLCAIGWAGIGTATSLPALYALYALAGFGAAIVYCGSIGVALKWFPDRRGLASGVIAAGFGSGSALFIPVIRSIWPDLGPENYASAFLYTGIVQGTLIVLAAQFLGGSGMAAHAPAPAASAAKAAVNRSAAHDFTSGEMLRTMHFYWLYAMMLMMGIGGLLATAQVSAVANNFGVASILGWSLTINPIANGTGRVFWGLVSDRLGRERTMMIAFTIQSAALAAVMALGPGSPVMFLIAMAMVFFTWGEVYVLFPAASADFFGRKNASSNYSFLYSTKGVASIIAGGLAAQLFDSTGSWAPAFYGSAVLAIITAGMALGLKRMPAPAKPPSAVTASARAATR